MRKFNVVLAALTLGTFSAAFAQATSTTDSTSTNLTGTATVTNNAADELAVSGTGLTVTLTTADIDKPVANNGGFVDSTTGNTLTYSTHKSLAGVKRSIAVRISELKIGDVLQTGLQDGITVRVTAATPVGSGTGALGSTKTFSGTALDNQTLVTLIDEFIVDGTTAVTYAVRATKGFNTFSGTLTYTLGTGF